MIIPIPNEFGEKALCNNKLLPFSGVSWFKWSEGMEYTYFFATNDEWHPTDFYTTFKCETEKFVEIPDNLLDDGFMKDKGFPLKGRGYANGVYYDEGRIYIDFIMTSNYLAHIRVQCDEHCKYISGGDIIFPPSWDTEEKREKAMLKSIKFIVGDPLVIKPNEPKQMSIFDYIN